MTETLGIVSEKLRTREMVGHAVACIGQMFIYTFYSNYMLNFYTDIVGLAATVASAIMSLTMIWSAISDPLMGVIADRTRTRWGRYRPYLLFASIPLVIIFVLTFSAPDLSPGAKVAYAAVTYVAMSTVFTSVDVPLWTLPAAMGQTEDERSRIITVSMGITQIAGAVLGIIAVPLILLMGGLNGRGYMLAAVALGAFGLVCYLFGFCTIREHISPPNTPKLGIKAIKIGIFQNKPLLIVLAFFLVYQAGYMLRNTIMMYYMRYNLGSVSLNSVFNTVGVVGIVIGVVATPLLLKKLEPKWLLVWTSFFTAAVNIVYYLLGYQNSVPLLVGMYLLASIPTGVIFVTVPSMIADTIEYVQWKSGKRCDAVISSTRTLITKCGVAVGTALSGTIITAVRFVPNVQQSEFTLTGFHFCFTLGVGILSAVMGVIILFHNLTREKHRQIAEELRRRGA